MSPYLDLDPRTLEQAMRDIMSDPVQWSAYDSATRQWIRDELNAASPRRQAA